MGKVLQWAKARERLKKEYQRRGITVCERCEGTFVLSFHHLEKRSTGRAKHTFKDTRLLCAVCHEICEYNIEENDKLRDIR